MDIELMWRQIEGMLLVVDDERRQVQPYTHAANLIEKLNSDKEYLKLGKLAYCAADFQPEGASYNLESAPEKPWGVSDRDLLDVEANMKSRYGLFRMQSVFTLMQVLEFIGEPSL